MCRWSLIAGRLPGRTDNEIKNYWNTHIRRKLLSRGVDPLTHRNVHDNNPHSSSSLSSDVTISFSKTTTAKEEIIDEKKVMMMMMITGAGSTGTGTSSAGSLEFSPELKRLQTKSFPELNLDLSISLPYPQEKQKMEEEEEKKKLQEEDRRRSACFSCRLGLQNSKDCRCNSRFLEVKVNPGLVLDMK